MDRRQFLVMASAGTALALSGAAGAAIPSPRASSDKSIWIDAQGGIDGLEFKDGKYVPTERLIAAIRERRIDILSQTVCELGNGPDRFRSAVELITQLDNVIRAYPELLAKVESAADLRSAKETRRLGIVYNFQDTTPLEGDAGKVGLFKALGVRIQQLTYNKRNLAGDGCLERSNAGLSDFGREVIAAVNSNGIVLNLSHSGQRTTAEAIAASRSPPSITHSGCRDLVDFPRNTYDREMRALADKGGVIGIYLMPFLREKGQPTREDLLRHLDHAVRIAGEDHVGIGTDGPLFGFTIDDAARQAQRKFYEERAARGVAAPGEAPDVFNMVEGYNDVARFDRIAADLRRRGWSSVRIDKVLGGNFERLFAEVWN